MQLSRTHITKARSGSGSFWSEQHMYYGRCSFGSEKSVRSAHERYIGTFLATAEDISITRVPTSFSTKKEGVDGKRIHNGKQILYRTSREALETHTRVWLKLWTFYGVCQFSMAGFKIDFQFYMSDGLTPAIRRPTRRTFKRFRRRTLQSHRVW